jgi:hypothetical protein
MLKLVPFHEGWVNHDRLDLHAIYRRPQLAEDEYGEQIQQHGPNGEPLWDITTPLPVRKHNKWAGKGYQYVTLANASGIEAGGALKYVRDAANTGTLAGGSVKDYSQDPRTGGPWNVRKYLEGQEQGDTAALAALREQVTKFGWETVEAIRREQDPHFRIPAILKGEPVEAVAAPVKAGRK